jgi:hypothetical protein
MPQHTKRPEAATRGDMILDEVRGDGKSVATFREESSWGIMTIGRDQ